MKFANYRPLGGGTVGFPQGCRPAISVLFSNFLNSSALLLSVLFMSFGQAFGQATVTTDKVDYFPNDVVTVTGKGWQPFETVNLVLKEHIFNNLGDNGLVDQVVADGSGNFVHQLYTIVQADLGAFFHLHATGASSQREATITFNDAGGDYGIDFSAYDPEFYDRELYADFILSNSLPSGRADSPLGDASGATLHGQTVESLNPSFLGLGQIVAFEYYVRVDAGAACSNDVIQIEGEWLTETTNGGAFGFDGNLGVVAAFVDTSNDMDFNDPDGDATVTNVSWVLNAETIESTIDIAGMDGGDEITIEVWLVLQSSITQNVGGNVKTRLGDARTIGGCEEGKINTGNQEVPLLQVGDFFTSEIDVSIVKSDSQDPVTIGDEFTYTLTIANAGPSVANDVEVIDNIDPNTEYVSHTFTDLTGASWTPASFTPGQTTLTFNTSFLDPGESADIIITVKVPETYAGTVSGTSAGTGGPGLECTGGDLCNTVTVTTISDGDTDPTNDNYAEPTGVQCPELIVTDINDSFCSNELNTVNGNEVIDLTSYNGQVGPQGATITWFEDLALNIPVGDPTQAIVSSPPNGAVNDDETNIFYAEVEELVGTGCTAIATLTVKVKAIPDLTVADRTVCADDGQTTATIDLTAEVTVSGAGLVEYYLNGVLDVDPTSSQVGTGDQVKVKAVSSSDPGCFVEKTFNITVTENPGCDFTGELAVCPGETGLQYSYSGTVVPGMTFSWTINSGGVITSGADTPTVTVDAGPDCGSSFELTLTTTLDGCTSTCIQTVIIDDTEAPTITFSDEILAIVGDGDLGYVDCSFQLPFGPGDITTTDNCDGAVTVGFTDVIISGDCDINDPESFITKYECTWTATDECGNVASETLIFLQVDTTDPTITTPAADETVECGPNNADQLQTWLDNNGGAAATDDCGTITWTNDYLTGPGLSDGCGETGSVTVTFTATDDCGNSSTTTATFTIVDTTPPVAVEMPGAADVTLECSDAAGIAAAEAFTPSFTDACSDNLSIKLVGDNVTTDPECPDAFTRIRKWTATDECNNVSEEYVQTITVVDETAPELTVPDDVTISCEADDSPAGTGSATATDNCDDDVEISYVDNVIAGACANERTIERTWTATDNCNNSSSKTVMIYVVDTTDPVITCSADIVAQPADAEECNYTATLAPPTVVEDCGLASLTYVITNPDGTTVNGLDAIGSYDYQVGITSIEWTATDNCGNTATCTHTVEVIDTQDPTIACPDDITQTADAGVCNAAVAVPSPVTDDNCGVASVVNDYNGTADASDIYPVGTTTVTWTVTDIHGNTATCTMDITVTDDEDPTIACPDDITQTADAGVCNAAVAVPSPVTDDNCGVASVVNDYNGTADASDTYPVGTTTVTWTVTDIHGNTATCTMDITVTDDEDPTIACPDDITQTADAGVCNAAVAVPSPVTDDNCGVASVVNDYNGTADASDTYPVGTTTVTWTVTDIHGNTATCTMDITVTDDEDPTIACPDDITQTADAGVCNAAVAVPSPVTDDNCGVASVVNDYNGTADASDTYPVGTTTVTWTVTDIHGNTATCTMDITVTDDEDPTIACPDDITQTADAGVCNAAVAVPSPVTDDNCGVASVVNDYNGTADASDTYPVGTTTVTWTVTDIHGNTATCTMDITVTDDEDPTIACPDDITQTADAGVCNAAVAVPSPVTDDNCGVASVVNDYNGTADASDTYPVGTTTVTWTVTDIHGNTATCTMDITVTDDEDPTIACPDDITQTADAGVCNAAVAVPSPVTDDNCGVASVVNDYNGTADASDTYPVGTTTVTWTVTDIHGNTATCTMDITVTDDEDPTIACPDDITQTADAGVCNAAVAVPSPVTDDNCGVASVVNDYNGTADASDTYPVGTTTVTWTVTDIHGNTATCTMDITVTDDEDPTIACPDDITQTADAGVCNAAVAVPSPVTDDNCGVASVVNDYNGTADASDTYPVGTTTVTWTVTDIHGNTATCTMDITVTDDEDPTIACPDDITQTADAGVCNAAVAVPSPVTDDNCGVASVVNDYNGTADASDTYPVGTTTVTWTVTDIHGNTATCTMDITVTDDEDPTIACPDDITQTADAGVCNAAVAVPSPVTDDNCGVASVVNDYNGTADASDTYPVGTTTVTWTVTDIHGNTATCTMDITVTDDEDPTIACPDDITQTADAGVCNAAVAVPSPVTDDNCGVASVVNDYNGTADASDTYPVGTTTVTWTVTDIHGNTATCTMDITVTDDEDPTIACPDDITQTADAGVCNAAVAVPSPVTDDNCGVASVVNDYNGTADASDTYPVGTTTVTWTVTDIHGNTATCTMDITVTDDEDPTIACPDDITQTADAGVCNAAVAVPSPVTDDNCGVASVVNDYNGTADASDTYPVGTTTVTWTVTDIHGNTATCTMDITVTDDEDPTIACPDDITQTADAGVCNAAVAVPSPVTDDNCGVASVVNDYNGTADASDTYPVGTTTVTWTVTDIHGNTATCTMDITVTDDEDPTIACPDDITQTADAGVCNAAVAVPSPVTDDNCGVASVVNDYNGTADASDTYPVGTTTVTWTVTDIHGNTATCTMDITVTDDEDPTIACPDDITQTADAGVCNAAVAVPSPVTDDNCGVASVVNDYNGTADASDTYPVGTTTVTWTVTDIHGNTATCTMDITVTDDEDPTIACPDDITQTADAGVCNAAVAVPSPVTDDNCGVASVVNDYNGTADASDTYPVGTTTVTWTVTDIHGNTATCTMDITVTDDEDPTIACPDDITQTADAGVCNAAVAVPSPVTDDNCGVASVVNDYNGTADASDTYPVGTTTVTWTVTDIHGNTATCTMDITVTDDEDPTIACPDDITQTADAGVCNAAVAVPSPVTDDNCGVASVVNDYNGTADASDTYPVGTTTVTWTVTDIHGNTATCTMEITVTDDEDPTIACPDDITQTADAGVCNAAVAVPSPVTDDNCGVASVVNDYNGTADASDTYPVGTTTVTWTVTDIHGNTATCTMDITVTDDEDPTIACPDDITQTADAGVCNAAVAVPSPVTDDNCGVASVVNDYNGTADASDTYPVGTTTVTWTVTDIHGNTATCTMDITVTDDEDPTIACPDDITQTADAGVCNAAVAVPSPVTDDNCGVASVVNDYNGTADASDTYPVGTTTVTWTVTDIHGNTATCTMDITVTDDEDPTIACPDDITQTADAGVCNAAVAVPSPVTDDNCGVASVVNDYNGTADASDTYPVGTTTVTWTVTDIHGNTATCTMDITVTDDEDPTIACPDDITQTADAGVCNAAVAVPSPVTDDNCGVASVVNDYNGTADASDTYPVGTTTVTWTVTDIHGNTATCTMDITVTDDEDPTIACPDDITQTADAGVCNAAVAVPSPVTDDNCGVASVVNDYNGTADASDIYPVGTTTVTWTVTDIHGNTATCTMDITVTDDEDPTIACPDDITQTADAGVCNAAVAVPSPVTDDNCGVASVVNDYNGTADASDTYPVGTTTVTWTVTDIHGNTATCTMDITVTDDEDPTIACPDDITQTADAGVCNAAVAVPSPVTDDNCGVASVVNDYNGTADASDTYPVGTTTVTWTVTDIHGNTATCTMDITVTDDEDPTIACPDDITQTADAGVCNAAVAVPSPVTDDNCGVASVVNDYNGTADASDTYPVGTTTVTWTVTDIHGNTATCTMDITVTDDEDPTIACPDDITQTADAGVCNAAVAVPSPVTDDNCGVASVVNDYNGTADASDTYPVGTTTVTWTVTDIHGNTATCTMDITVTDDEDPTIACPDDITQTADAGVCNAAVAVPSPVTDDNCGVASVVNDYNGTADASDTYPVGTTTVTWTVTDIHGNTATCTMEITVTDDEDPTIACPDDITQTADAGVCNAAVAVPSPVTDDNCGVASVVNDYNGTADASDTYPVGTTTVTWTVTDIHGNTATCTMDITVTDDEDPTIACPDDITQTADAGVCNAAVAVPSPVTDDNCGVASVVNDYNGTADASDTYPVGTTTVTWTVTDIHGNTATCTMDITVTDDEDPTIACPDDITQTADAGVCNAAVAVPSPVTDDNCGVASVVNDYNGTADASDTYPVGTTTVTWTVTDIHGNTATCTMDITVTDDEDPTIACPDDITQTADAGVCNAAVAVPSPVTDDNCGVASVVNDYNGTADASDTYPVGTTTVTWTVTDIHGNTATCTMDITVTDDEDPTIACPDDITQTADAGVCNAAVAVPSPVTDDNCGVASVVNDYNGTADASDTYPVGTTTVTWTVTDIHGNTATCTMDITVTDDEDPTIACPDDITQTADAGVCNAAVAVPSPVTDDNCGVASVVNDYNGTADASDTYPVGTTTVTWTVTDIHGNTATCTMDITVTDDEDPTIACPDDITQTADAGVCNAAVAVPSPVTDDNCGVASVVNDYNGTADASDTYPVGTTTVTWTVTDIHGNTATCTMEITVTDDEDPTIACPDDITQTADAGVCNAAVAVPSPVTDDNCGVASVVNDYNGTADASDTYPVGTTTVTWTVTDIHGNTATCTMDITVTDDEDPTIACPDDITQTADAGVCNAAVAVPSPVTDDNCGVASVVNDYNGTADASDTYPVGTTTVTWTVTDIHGNTATCTMDITVTDDEDPTIACPDDITQTADAGVCNAAVAVPTPVTDDNCGVASVVNDYNGTADASDTYPVGTTTVTWTVTDIHGNTATCTMDITVTDDEDPTIACPDDITQTADAGVCNAAVAVPSPVTDDNCGVASVVNDYNGTADASDTYPVGTTTVTWTVTDIHGNTATCTMDITVTDDEDPTIACPDDITQTADAGVCNAAVAVPSPVTDDNCGVASVVNDYNGTADASDTYPVGTTTVTWTVTDIHGNTATCTMDITVTDDEDPTIACPDDITQTADAGVCNAAVAVPTPVTDDNCGVASVVNDYNGTADASDTYPVGTTTVTWTVTDIHGNTATCTMDITVTDDEDPTIACPDDITQTADAGVCNAAVAVPSPVTDDNCGVASVVNDYNGTADASDTYPVGTTTVTWTVTDIHGNTATCTMEITVTDDEDPTIACPDDITQTADAGVCNAAVAVPSPVTDDNCGVASVVNDYNGTADASDTYPVGTTTVTWTVTDIHGNTATCTMDITVTDDEDPTIACPDDITQTADAGVCNAAVAVPSPVTDDNCGVASVVNDYNGTADASDTYPVGTTTVTWTVTDIHGNTATCTMDITVTDDEDPTIACPDDITQTADAGVCNAAVAVPSPVTDDNCGVASVVNDYNGTADASDTYPVGTTTVTWTVTDIHGNTATCTMDITVTDDEDPTIACPDDITQTADAGVCNAAVAVPSPVTDDNCGVASVVNDYNGTADASDTYPVGTTTVTWTVTDIHGNTATCTMDITVTDDEDPTIACPDDITQTADAGVCNAAVAVPSPVTDDNCGVASVVNDYNGTADASDTYPVGTTTVTWTVTDIHGNTATCTMEITVTDDEDPIIDTGASDLAVECDGAGNAADLQAWLASQAGAQASDNCGPVDWTDDFEGLSDDCGATGMATVTFTATDGSGNSSTTTATFTIVDTTPPVITADAEDLTVECDGAGNLDELNDWLADNGGAEANDACGGVVWSNDFEEVSDECGATGSVTVTFTATDDCGLQSTTTATFTIEDTTPPVITADAQDGIAACGLKGEKAFYEWLFNNGGAEATDDCGDVTWSNNCPDPHGACEVTVIFTATDECGNSTDTEATFTFTNEAPVIETPAMDMTVECDGMALWELHEWLSDNGGAVASDDCSDLEWTNDFDGLTNTCGDAGSVTVTFTATDDCGLYAVTTATFTIEDTTDPMIVLMPEDEIVECDGLGNTTAFDDWIAEQGGAFAVDDCGEVTWTYEEIESADFCGLTSETTIRFIATDNCGNSSFADAKFIIQDTTPPALVGMPDDAEVCTGATYTFAIPTVTDDCAGGESILPGVTTFPEDAQLTIDFDNGFITGIFTEPTKVTFTAEDGCGNSTEETISIFIDQTSVAAVEVDQPECYDDNGEARVLVDGSVPDGNDQITIEWTGPNGFTSDQAVIGGDEFLEEGEYSVIITNVEGCVSTDSFILDRPAAISCEIDIPAFEQPVCGEHQTNVLSATVTYDASETDIVNYEWTFVDPDDLMTPVPGWYVVGDQGPEIMFAASSSPAVAILVVTDKNGCVSQCSIELEACQSAQFCSFTQGFYGGEGGIGCQLDGAIKTAGDLMQSAIPNGESQLFGIEGNMKVFELFGSEIADETIFTMMPGGGPSKALAGYATYGDLNTWNNVPIKNNGGIGNVLLSQTMALYFNIVQDSLQKPDDILALHQVVISGQYLVTATPVSCGSDQAVMGQDQYTTIPQEIINVLNDLYGGSPTIGDLYELANGFLGADQNLVDNYGNISLSSVTAAVDAINRGFDECRILIGFSNSDPEQGSRNDPEFAGTIDAENIDVKLAARGSTIDLNAYPNPFTTKATIKFVVTEKTHAVLQVYDLNGMEVQKLFDGTAEAGEVYEAKFDATALPKGMYIYRLVTEQETAVGSLVPKDRK